MARFIDQKQFNITKSHYKVIEKKSKKSGFFIKILWTIFIVFILVYWWYFFLKKTIFAFEYTIKKINYNSGDLSEYSNQSLYNQIKKIILNENFYVVRWNKSNILNQIKINFPFISKLNIQYLPKNKISISLEFIKPDLIIKNQNFKFWVYKWFIFSIASWDKIWNWVITIALPDYLENSNSISWFFFRQSPEELIEQFNLINQWFPNPTSIQYLPWWERTIVYRNNKKIYINNLADIIQQIKKFDLLKKYYSNYPKLTEIDLGSLEKDKIIVK
jgi:hypothetical protein